MKAAKVVSNGQSRIPKSNSHELKEMSGDEFIDNPLEGPRPGMIARSQDARPHFLDLIVCNASGPMNFYVQDYRQSAILKQLENEMTEFYKDCCKKFKPLDIKDVKPNGFYAGYDEERKGWFRVQISNYTRDDEANIPAQLIDHGSFTTVHVVNLRPLKKQFVDRLPIQAYPARLQFMEGAEAIKPEDCVRFKKEVEQKSFIGLVTDEKEDKILKRVYTLILVDTSGPDDRYVHPSYMRVK